MPYRNRGDGLFWLTVWGSRSFMAGKAWGWQQELVAWLLHMLSDQDTEGLE